MTTMKALILALLLASWQPLMAQVSRESGSVCPPDRPIARDVVRFDQILTCNAVAYRKLVCPTESNAPCMYVMGSSCPPAAVERQCFTVEEIERATREK